MFENKIVIVTGCSKGIGEDITKSYLELGAVVYGIARSSIVTSLINKPKFILMQGSVADEVFVSECINTITSNHGRIDILINNAGISADNLFQRMTDEEWKKVIEVNFKGTFNFCRNVLPYFKSQKFGRIVNVVSKSGVVGREGQINYATSKGAIIGLTRTIARKYGSFNIICNAIAPALVETQMVAEIPADKISSIISCTSMQRIAQTKDITSSVLHLTAISPSYQNGAVIQLDGGFLI
ncbi:3-oxoacyl-[acyl-carrier protein] reductase [Moritella sp. JT01]|uniref:SDR family NAD(P)-dependent oxidoreductase n=1 Tax=Moritella sp. JT01 TaxID=756698 RepID=UPI000798D080|nr:SDR family NAD(P)-dependent oxidoreductase [Moritella sp. JT01]KXO12880.1 3-oxoacyl-[acyl-carrier protein] reductase [Moritella sp. JT01]